MELSDSVLFETRLDKISIDSSSYKSRAGEVLGYLTEGISVIHHAHRPIKQPQSTENVLLGCGA